MRYLLGVGNEENECHLVCGPGGGFISYELLEDADEIAKEISRRLYHEGKPMAVWVLKLSTVSRYEPVTIPKTVEEIAAVLKGDRDPEDVN